MIILVYEYTFYPVEFLDKKFSDNNNYILIPTLRRSDFNFFSSYHTQREK